MIIDDWNMIEVKNIYKSFGDLEVLKGVNLSEHMRCALWLYERCVGDLSVHHSAFFQAPRYPKQLVLKQRKVFIIGVSAVEKH